jgi:hypothetical protein
MADLLETLTPPDQPQSTPPITKQHYKEVAQKIRKWYADRGKPLTDLDDKNVVGGWASANGVQDSIDWTDAPAVPEAAGVDLGSVGNWLAESVGLKGSPGETDIIMKGTPQQKLALTAGKVLRTAPMFAAGLVAGPEAAPVVGETTGVLAKLLPYLWRSTKMAGLFAGGEAAASAGENVTGIRDDSLGDVAKRSAAVAPFGFIPGGKKFAPVAGEGIGKSLAKGAVRTGISAGKMGLAGGVSANIAPMEEDEKLTAWDRFKQGFQQMSKFGAVAHMAGEGFGAVGRYKKGGVPPPPGGPGGDTPTAPGEVAVPEWLDPYTRAENVKAILDNPEDPLPPAVVGDRSTFGTEYDDSRRVSGVIGRKDAREHLANRLVQLTRAKENPAGFTAAEQMQNELELAAVTSQFAKLVKTDALVQNNLPLDLAPAERPEEWKAPGPGMLDKGLPKAAPAAPAVAAPVPPPPTAPPMGPEQGPMTASPLTTFLSSQSPRSAYPKAPPISVPTPGESPVPPPPPPEAAAPAAVAAPTPVKPQAGGAAAPTPPAPAEPFVMTQKDLIRYERMLRNGTPAERKHAKNMLAMFTAQEGPSPLARVPRAPKAPAGVQPANSGVMLQSEVEAKEAQRAATGAAEGVTVGGMTKDQWVATKLEEMQQRVGSIAPEARAKAISALETRFDERALAGVGKKKATKVVPVAAAATKTESPVPTPPKGAPDVNFGEAPPIGSTAGSTEPVHVPIGGEVGTQIPASIAHLKDHKVASNTMERHVFWSSPTFEDSTGERGVRTAAKEIAAQLPTGSVPRVLKVGDVYQFTVDGGWYNSLSKGRKGDRAKVGLIASGRKVSGTGAFYSAKDQKAQEMRAARRTGQGESVDVNFGEEPEMGPDVDFGEAPAKVPVTKPPVREAESPRGGATPLNAKQKASLGVEYDEHGVRLSEAEIAKRKAAAKGQPTVEVQRVPSAGPKKKVVTPQGEDLRKLSDEELITHATEAAQKAHQVEIDNSRREITKRALGWAGKLNVGGITKKLPLNDVIHKVAEHLKPGSSATLGDTTRAKFLNLSKMVKEGMKIRPGQGKPTTEAARIPEPPKKAKELPPDTFDDQRKARLRYYAKKKADKNWQGRIHNNGDGTYTVLSETAEKAPGVATLGEVAKANAAAKPAPKQAAVSPLEFTEFSDADEYSRRMKEAGHKNFVSKVNNHSYRIKFTSGTLPPAEVSDKNLQGLKKVQLAGESKARTVEPSKTTTMPKPPRPEGEGWTHIPKGKPVPEGWERTPPSESYDGQWARSKPTTAKAKSPIPKPPPPPEKPAGATAAVPSERSVASAADINLIDRLRKLKETDQAAFKNATERVNAALKKAAKDAGISVGDDTMSVTARRIVAHGLGEEAAAALGSGEERLLAARRVLREMKGSKPPAELPKLEEAPKGGGSAETRPFGQVPSLTRRRGGFSRLLSDERGQIGLDIGPERRSKGLDPDNPDVQPPGWRDKNPLRFLQRKRTILESKPWVARTTNVNKVLSEFFNTGQTVVDVERLAEQHGTVLPLHNGGRPSETLGNVVGGASGPGDMHTSIVFRDVLRPLARGRMLLPFETGLDLSRMGQRVSSVENQIKAHAEIVKNLKARLYGKDGKPIDSPVAPALQAQLTAARKGLYRATSTYRNLKRGGGLPMGLTPREIKLQRIAFEQSLTPEQLKQVNDGIKVFQNQWDEIIENGVADHIMKPTDAKQWRAEGDYGGPLRRMMTDAGVTDAEMATAMMQAGSLKPNDANSLMQFVGSELTTEGAIKSNVIGFYQVTKLGMRNRALRQIRQMMLRDTKFRNLVRPETEAHPAGPGEVAIPIYDDGVKRRWIFPATLAKSILAAPINEFTLSQKMGHLNGFLKLQNASARWGARSMIQYSLGFLVGKNPIADMRDTRRTIAVKMPDGKIVRPFTLMDPRDIMKSTVEFIRNAKQGVTGELLEDPFYHKWVYEGGKASTLARAMYPEQHFESVLKIAGKEGERTLVISPQIASRWRGLIDAGVGFTEATEEASKLYAAQRLVKAGVGMGKATFESRRNAGTPDPGQIGFAGPQMAQTFLFINSAIKGRTRLLKAWYNNPRLMGKVIAASIAAEGMRQLWQSSFRNPDGRPEDDHISRDFKASAAVFCVPGTLAKNSSGTYRYSTIGIPYGYTEGMLFGIGRVAVPWMYGKATDKQLAEAVLNNLLPGQSRWNVDHPAQSVIDMTSSMLFPAAGGTIDLIRNRSASAGQEINPSKMDPETEYYPELVRKPSTPHTIQGLTMGLNFLLGSNITPTQTHYALNRQFPAPTQEVTKLIDLVMQAATAQLTGKQLTAVTRRTLADKAKAVPGFGSIVGRLFRSGEIDQIDIDRRDLLYRLTKKADDVAKAPNMKVRETKGETLAHAQAVLVQEDPEIGLAIQYASQLRNYRRQLAGLQTQRADIWNRSMETAVSPAEAKKAMDDYQRLGEMQTRILADFAKLITPRERVPKPPRKRP